MINYKEKSETRPWVPSYDRRKKHFARYLAPASDVEHSTIRTLNGLMFMVWIFLAFYFGSEFLL